MRVSAVGTSQDRYHFLERTDAELRECPEPSHEPSLRMALGSLVLRVSLVTCTRFMVRSPPAFFTYYEDNDNADNNRPRPPYRFGCPFHINQNTLGSYQSLDARLVISGARQRGRCRERADGETLRRATLLRQTRSWAADCSRGAGCSTRKR